jgi:dTDP-4-amino-4,6-dideoxygalactose transaminase
MNTGPVASTKKKAYNMSEVIPFVDLKQQYDNHRDLLEKAISDVCCSSAFILGPEVERFEKRFAEFIGCEEAIGVASGTDALRMSCHALGIGPGDEVIVPANTFIASTLGVVELGASLVIADIDPQTYLIDLKDAECKVTANTKAIIPVHLYGQCADADAVMAFAEEHDLLVIEDACQAHGAKWNGRCAGTNGAVGCFSMYPAKNLGAFGDAGLITTNNSKLAEELRMVRNYGSQKKYYHEIQGTNSRLDSIQAAVLNVKLEFLDDWNRRRFAAACHYADGLQGIESVRIPEFCREETSRHVFHLFVIQCDRRDELMAFLDARGIQNGIHYPVPLHLHGAFRFLGLGKGSMPVAEAAAARILSLPMFPEIANEQIDRVVEAIREFYGS